MKRRDLLKILGVSSSAMAFKNCFIQEVPGKMFPYVHGSDHIIAGRPAYFATTCRECPAGCGMIVTTREGRSLKAEGNPDHPVNQGKLCPRGQASLQGLYNPQRYRNPLSKKLGPGQAPMHENIEWDDAIGRIALIISSLVKSNKAGRIAVVTGALDQSLAKQVDALLAAIGAPARITYETFGMEAQRAANRASFGMDEVPALLFDKAGFILSLNSQLFECGPSMVEHARLIADARVKWGEDKKRFVAAGPRMDLMAANADEWLMLRPGTEGVLALALVKAIVDNGWAPSTMMGSLDDYKKATRSLSMDQAAKTTGLSTDAINKLAKDFAANSPGIAVGGPFIGPYAADAWQAINLLNGIAGNINNTIVFGTGTVGWSSYADLSGLADRMEAGEVELIIMLNAPSVACSPLATRFASALAKVPTKIALTTLPDAFTEQADFILPVHHFLEDWGFYSPRHGIYSLVQPTRRPLYSTGSTGDVVMQLNDKINGTQAPDGGYAGEVKRYFSSAAVGAYWIKLRLDQQPAAFWNNVRQGGGLWGSLPSLPVNLTPAAFNVYPSPAPAAAEELTLTPFSSILTYDGRGADRPWLRETPDPMSRIAWDAWVEVHPATALRLTTTEGDVLRITTDRGKGEWPVKVTPQVAPGVLAVPMSPKAEAGGLVTGDLLSLLDPKPAGLGPAWSAVSVQATRTGVSRGLATVQPQLSQVGRGIARYTDYHGIVQAKEEWREKNARQHPPRENMYRGYEYPVHKWEMVIDLERCVGCGACVVACYAENNLAVVGRNRLHAHREMAWMRIERYYAERNGRLQAIFIPMLCQQCDNAPCESVCPVFATVHSPEGVNEQIYNRCIGTRFCSNNCPYKVRRFNWFDYKWPEPLQLQLNPEVTVRSKGVMEKCNFCEQRILWAEQDAKWAGRKLKDGDIIPACAQTCPTNAIVFGDADDPDSRVSQMKKSGRGYQVLSDLNTQPAITYLKRLVRKA